MQEGFVDDDICGLIYMADKYVEGLPPAENEDLIKGAKEVREILEEIQQEDGSNFGRVREKLKDRGTDVTAIVAAAQAARRARET